MVVASVSDLASSVPSLPAFSSSGVSGNTFQPTLSFSDQIAAALSGPLATLESRFERRLASQDSHLAELLRAPIFSSFNPIPSQGSFAQHPGFPDPIDIREAGPSYWPSASQGYFQGLADTSGSSSEEDGSSGTDEDSLENPSSSPSLGDFLDLRFREVFPLMRVSSKAQGLLSGQFPEFRFFPFRAVCSSSSLLVDDKRFDRSEVF